MLKNETWPRCPATVTIFDHDLSCVLPRYHDYDGHTEHRDPSGTRWSLLVEVREDGVELDVLKKHL